MKHNHRQMYTLVQQRKIAAKFKLHPSKIDNDIINELYNSEDEVYKLNTLISLLKDDELTPDDIMRLQYYRTRLREL